VARAKTGKEKQKSSPARKRAAGAPRASPRALLATYRAKRDFSRTAEPSGAEKAPASKSLAYVIQKHDASHLHYDFRLELDGVLKSWAVPKGPSLDPARKVLAVQVEDHPLAYGDFEGRIPEGQYGGGTVMLWDRGTWEPVGDAREGLKNGKLHFLLHGEKLRGEWALVRMAPKENERRSNWLLMKVKDSFAESGREVTVDSAESVKSGRGLEEIAGNPGATWNSHKTALGKAGQGGADVPAPRPPRKAAPAPRRGGRKSEPAVAGEEAPFPIRVTHPDKVLYPGEGVTKRDLLAYYQLAEKWMLPLVADRPLTLMRCPNGVGEAARGCFYQRNWTGSFPPLVKGAHAYEGQPQLAIQDLNGLLSLVQMSVLEIHTWGCLQGDLKHPDQLVLDLDPGPGLPWSEVVKTARTLREMLSALKIKTFVKTTGGKGLHLLMPIEPNVDWEAAHDFCEQIAAALVKQSDRVVMNMRKDLRAGKLYIDFQRNHETATAVAAYSTRARAGAAVSMPVEWDQLADIRSGDQFTVKEAMAYLRRRKRDPWADFEKARADLRKIAAGRGK